MAEFDARQLFGRRSLGIQAGAAAAVLVLIGLAVFVTQGLVVVDSKEVAVLIRKTGAEPPSGTIIAGPDQRGIQIDMLPEGWHWKNPYSWDWKIVPQIEIKPNEVGVQVRNFGEPMPAGQVIAGDGQKGVIAAVLRPGRYVINPYAYTVKTFPAVNIPTGHVGVKTLVSGKEPLNPNDFLVEEGERGIQKQTLAPGTYYVNPFVERIIAVDARSHRFDMSAEKVIRFPSLDGFDITMDGTIEWYIDPARVAEVYVKYVDERPVEECITKDIILPYARTYSRIEGSKHLARDFIGGLTREKFQEEFLRGVKTSCASRGILIQSALIRQITPPDAIAKPIKEREIAIRLKEMYEQQKERERQQKLLAMEEKMKERKTLLTQAGADVSVAITKATQEKEVAQIQAERQLEVAKLQLKAAENQAQARLAEGKAKADVVVFKNAAEAQGLKNAALAFGDGHTYVRYLLNLKLAPAFGYILSNTDGPFAELLRRAMEAKGKAPAAAPKEAGR